MPHTVSALSARNHFIFWSSTFFLFLAFVWVFSDMLLPFVLGLAIAYLLNPMMEYLGGHKVPRWIAALLILGLFFAFVLSLLAVAMPPLYREASELANALPGYIEQLSEMLSPYIGWLQEELNNGDLTAYREALQNNIGKAFQVSADILGGLANGGQAFAGFISVTVLTPIVAFFMMKEWANMTKWIDNLLPRGSYKTLKDLQKQMDEKLAGFVRGQITVAFALAVIYAVALSIAGLKFGLLIGIMAGVLSIIPLVGSTIGLLVSVIVAWLQAGEWSYVAIIASIFLVGQFIEGNFLTPRLLGKSVGLHPLWILFALLAGGSLFGIVGMLLAVPVAAIIGVLLGFAITQYKASPYYKDGKKRGVKKAKKKTTKRGKPKTRRS